MSNGVDCLKQAIFRLSLITIIENMDQFPKSDISSIYDAVIYTY